MLLLFLFRLLFSWCSETRLDSMRWERKKMIPNFTLKLFHFNCFVFHIFYRVFVLMTMRIFFNVGENNIVEKSWDENTWGTQIVSKVICYRLQVYFGKFWPPCCRESLNSKICGRKFCLQVIWIPFAAPRLPLDKFANHRYQSLHLKIVLGLNELCP